MHLFPQGLILSPCAGTQLSKHDPRTVSYICPVVLLFTTGKLPTEHHVQVASSKPRSLGLILIKLYMFYKHRVLEGSEERKC